MNTTRTASRTLRSLIALLGVTALPLALVACGSDGDSAGGSAELPEGDVVIVADNIAWDTDELEGPADEEFVIVIDNRDSGVQHNLTIKDTEFTTPLESGPVAQVLPVTLPAGEYEYICDLHPNMTGTLTTS